MLALLLSCALSWGQDVAAEDVDKVIGPVTSGQTVALDDKKRVTFKLSGSYWLIRDDALRAAIANAKAMPKLETALGECRDAALECGVTASEAWGTMRAQFDTDTDRIDAFIKQNSAMTVELALTKADLDRVRRQRNVAYGIAGGVTAAVLIGTGVGLGVTFAH